MVIGAGAESSVGAPKRAAVIVREVFSNSEYLFLAWRVNMPVRRPVSERSRGNLARETVSRLTPCNVLMGNDHR